MSDPTPPHAVLLPWRGQKVAFAFAVDQWRVIQRECDVGPWVLCARLTSRACTEAEVRAALVQGLVGGGMALAAADKVFDQNTTGRGRLEEARLVAQAAVYKSLYEVDGELSGETSAPGKGKTTPKPRTGKSPSPAS